MSPISVLHVPHQTLEADVDAYLRDAGFLTFAAPYHATMPHEIQERLAFNYSYTSLYLRARADRIAIHESSPLVFEWEVKTHDNSRFPNLCIELLPFMHHVQKASLGVRCLYVFRIPYTGQEGGFWVNKRPAMRDAWITSRVTKWRAGLVDRVRCMFPEASVYEKDPRGGSKDPFLIIDQSEVARQKHWSILIDEAARSSSASAPY